MCCGDCNPIRCAAVPGIDWSGYTWLWQSPDAAIEYEYEGQIDGTPRNVGRRIYATEREMVHTGLCSCLWLVPISDFGRDLNDPNSIAAPVPSIGSLQREGQGWVLNIARWYYFNWEYFQNQIRGWDFAVSDGCAPWAGGSAGWSPYGWNGWEWGYGFGNGWATWANAFATRARYFFPGNKLLTDGSPNEFLIQSLISYDDEIQDADNLSYWPAFVNLTTVPKDGQALE